MRDTQICQDRERTPWQINPQTELRLYNERIANGNANSSVGMVVGGWCVCASCVTVITFEATLYHTYTKIGDVQFRQTEESEMLLRSRMDMAAVVEDYR